MSDIVSDVKRYGQACAAARALDVVGDRWTVLVIRELLVGPRRYTDLSAALPGIGPNILAGRLEHLRGHGVVSRRTLPPPAPAAVYELTDTGRALGPVLAELRRWGRRHGPAPEAGDAIRSSWLVQDAAAGGRLAPGLVCELCVDGERFALTGVKRGVLVGSADEAGAAPDAVVSIDADDLRRLTDGELKPAKARKRLSITGDRDVAGQVIDLLGGAAQR